MSGTKNNRERKQAGPPGQPRRSDPEHRGPSSSSGESVEVAGSGVESASGEALPEGWAWARLDECLTITNGRAYKRAELLSEGTPVLRIQNLNGGDNWFYSDLELPENKYCDPGDLLYAWSATFGPYRYTGPRAIYHYHIWLVKTLENLDHSFAYHLLREITDELKASSRGVAMPHITKGGMEAWEVTLPPLAEQSRIVSAIESLQERSSRARDLLSEVGPLIGQLRQSVLRGAFSGKLTAAWRANNPVAEPASELLFRIRAERRQRWERWESFKYEIRDKKVPKNLASRYPEPEGIEIESDKDPLPHNPRVLVLGNDRRNRNRRLR